MHKEIFPNVHKLLQIFFYITCVDNNTGNNFDIP